MSDIVCKFYIKKRCTFGKNCKFIHSTSQQPPPVTLNPRETKDQHEEYLKEEVSRDIPKTSNNFDLKKPTENESLIQESPESVSQRPQVQLFVEDNQRDKHAGHNYAGYPDRTANRSVCFSFERYGTCRYGKYCRFLHRQAQSPGYGQRRPEGRQSSNKSKAEVPPRFRKATEEIETAGKPEETELVSSGNQDTAECIQKVDSYPDNQKPVEIISTENGKKDELKPQRRQPEERNGRENNSVMRRECSYFKRGFCKKGENCRFVHVANRITAPKETDAVEKPESIDESANLDSNKPEESKKVQFKQPQRPDNETLRSNHAARYPPAMALRQIYTYTELEKMDVGKLRDLEISVIKKRFPRDKITIMEESETSFSALISFTPTDPDWTFDAHVFELLVTIPLGYPREMLKVELPMEQNLPETVRRYVEIEIKEWLDQKSEELAKNSKVELVFRPFLRWLDKSIEDITMEALKQLKRELVAKACGMEFIPVEKLQAKFRVQNESSTGEQNIDQTSENETGDDDSSADCSEDESDGEDESDASSEGSLDNKTMKQLSVDPEKKGTEISLRNLQLRENASALLFERLKLVLQCGRCKNHSDVLVAPGRVVSVQCQKCNQNQFVHFRTALMHQFSSVAGYLDVDGCQPFDLIFQDCRVAVSCMGCSKQTRIDGLAAGHLIDAWCQACNARFKIATEAVKFNQLVPSTIETAGSKVVEVSSGKSKKLPKDPAIKEGCPLPEFGTCKHYKHSYRWLRFPCCGKAYPCDVCHDKKEDHEMEYATRMICGHCCREQNFSATRPCSACGQHLTKIRTSHWEGGSGCRDKISMSKSDQQKYKNMNKTVSSHHKKVQAAGQKKKTTKLRHS